MENSAQFSRWQPWILLVNVCGVMALMVLLARKLWQLFRDFRDHVPGSRLTMRTVVMFGALVIAPLVDRLSVLTRIHQSRHRQLVPSRDQAGPERRRGAVARGARSAPARAGPAHRDLGALAARAAADRHCCSGWTRSGAPPKPRRSPSTTRTAAPPPSAARTPLAQQPAPSPPEVALQVAAGRSYVSLESARRTASTLIETAAPIARRGLRRTPRRRYVLHPYEVPEELVGAGRRRCSTRPRSTAICRRCASR